LADGTAATWKDTGAGEGSAGSVGPAAGCASWIGSFGYFRNNPNFMSLPSRVVNVDSALEKTTGYQWLDERVRAAGGELVLCRAVTEEALIAACADASIVVVEHPQTPIKARVIAAMTQGRAIVKCAVGLDNIDVDSASANGIVVC